MITTFCADGYYVNKNLYDCSIQLVDGRRIPSTGVDAGNLTFVGNWSQLGVNDGTTSESSLTWGNLEDVVASSDFEMSARLSFRNLIDTHSATFSINDAELTFTSGQGCDVFASADLTGASSRCLVTSLTDDMFYLDLNRTATELVIGIDSERVLNITNKESEGLKTIEQFVWTQNDAIVLIKSWKIQLGYADQDLWCMSQVCDECPVGKFRKNSQDLAFENYTV